MSSKQCTCGADAAPGRRECQPCRHHRLKTVKAGNPVRKSTDKPAAPVVPPAEQVALDREQNKLRAELKIVKAKYQESLKTVEQQESELRVVAGLKDGLATHVIEPVHPAGTGEATAVIVASDWHIEENVGAEVGGLNVFNLHVAEARIAKFFSNSLRLVQLLGRDTKIETVVLALLGDFISGEIHGADSAEMNEAQPNHALVIAQNHIISGIEFLLANSTYSYVIPCHSGNHARTTLKIRYGAENGHSLEYLLYLHLAAYFRNEPRVKFIIPEGPHSYVQVYNTVLRFQHGHLVKFGGGVGGIYIPLAKAVHSWNRARHADLDILGHFHQQVDGGHFLVNGSLIGYNSFALAMRCNFERPKQLMFLLDKKRGRTFTCPVVLDI